MKISPLRKRLIIILVSLFILFVGFILWFGSQIAGGSYAYAERYEFNTTEEEVIQAINEFKISNPEYIVPKTKVPTSNQLFDLPDERGGFQNLYYFSYFYYSRENKILFTYIRQVPFINEKKTTLAFISVNDGLTLGNWKTVNRDFSRSENKEQIKKFEEEILSKLESRLGKHNQTNIFSFLFN